ncbi:hypothetical protein RZS08_61200, partial [Arthrospira platensis SPKY1]|nr:hypothetical protein [Arthrospira platensis SPKY1]
MGDTSLHEHFARRLEAKAGVEALRGQLRIEHELVHPEALGFGDQRGKQTRTHALAPPAGQHCHPTDMPVRQQTTGADDAAVRQHRHRVPASRVSLVELDLGGHALLLHEYRHAHR